MGLKALPDSELVPNDSCSLWSRTTTLEADPATTVVGSGKQPTWTTARRVFVVGVFCGLLAGELVRARRRGLRALAAVPLRNDLRTQLAVIGRGVGRRDRRRS